MRSRLRDPCADRSDGECQPEKKMRCASEPFRHRIEKNQRERYGREDARQPINCARGQQKPGRTRESAKPRPTILDTSKWREAVRGLR